MAVPWCFKVLYGFLSDCVPINGERRKPYLMLGWFIYLITNLILAAMGEPSISAVIFFVFIMTSAYMLADVMTDALIVERSTYETRKGDLQSRGYIIRFFGSTCGAGEGWGGRGEGEGIFFVCSMMKYLKYFLPSDYGDFHVQCVREAL